MMRVEIMMTKEVQRMIKKGFFLVCFMINSILFGTNIRK